MSWRDSIFYEIIEFDGFLILFCVSVLFSVFALFPFAFHPRFLPKMNFIVFLAYQYPCMNEYSVFMNFFFLPARGTGVSQLASSPFTRRWRKKWNPCLLLLLLSFLLLFVDLFLSTNKNVFISNIIFPCIFIFI